eukprot:TRINITY_DN9_c0_g1_i3.p1 TRINITY_DN9_c0_g1~~TRINITY_DN9_c0_g1_i3.p1  ORF type:complete len:800 (-),score=288.90 TRINITY_DN9_c0_g1_i3:337-2736(-)
MSSAAIETTCLILIYIIVVVGLFFTKWLRDWVMACPDNDRSGQMLRHARNIQKGAYAFLRVQYWTIAKLSGIVAVVLFIVYITLRTKTDDVGISPAALGILTVLAFLFGAVCSGASGIAGMYIAVHTNVRAAVAAEESADKCLKVCFRGGAFTGMLIVCLSLFGVSTMYFIARVMVGISAEAAPTIIVGFGFGASFVALFAQLGGGIYTKAADVGADIIGKVEKDLPEDDSRNPAVVADLVGDNVGDCAGRGADLFESTAAENIGAMILGATVANGAGIETAGFVLYPLMLRAVGMIASMIAILLVYSKPQAGGSIEGLSFSNSHFPSDDQSTNSLSTIQTSSPSTASASSSSSSSAAATTATISALPQTTPRQHDNEEDPMKALMRGYLYCLAIATVLMIIVTRILLYTDLATKAWLAYCGCGFIGILLSWAFVLITDYYTGTDHKPVIDIAHSAQQGHGTVVITGMAVGMESTGMPCICISLALISSYWIGAKCGLPNEDEAGIFGTAAATMGMLITVGFVLAMDTFGPISDNAGGIAEMSHAGEDVRARTDRLDAVGNTTKALTKGYAVGSAGLATFLLFRAYLDDVFKYTGDDRTKAVDFAVPEVFVAGFVGACLVYFFSALALKAVGNAAQTVIIEARRQFQNPNVLKGTEDPDYEQCIKLVTESSLKEMIAPGLLVVGVPILLGLLMRALGAATYRNWLPAQCMASLLMIATISGILMGLFLNNAGGAWDNAKKLTEVDPAYGGKGTETHKCAVTGDTVGDPFKDTAGPSLHVLVKLLSTISLVLYPLFVAGK